MNTWQPIETAPKDDEPIFAWCEHAADPYMLDSGKLTVYGAHTEGLSHVEDGYAVVVWGGGFDDRTYFEPDGVCLPDWWFVHGTEFEVTANPTHWMRPSPPKGKAPSSDWKKRWTDGKNALPEGIWKDSLKGNL